MLQKPGYALAVLGTTVSRNYLNCFVFSAPAKPLKPIVQQIGNGAVNVTYNFAVGGGWTHEFKVLYKMKGEKR